MKATLGENQATHCNCTPAFLRHDLPLASSFYLLNLAPTFSRVSLQPFFDYSDMKESLPPRLSPTFLWLALILHCVCCRYRNSTLGHTNGLGLDAAFEMVYGHFNQRCVALSHALPRLSMRLRCLAVLTTRSMGFFMMMPRSVSE